MSTDKPSELLRSFRVLGTQRVQTKAAEDSRTAMSCVKGGIGVFPFFSICFFLFCVLAFPAGAESQSNVSLASAMVQPLLILLSVHGPCGDGAS